MLTKYSENSQKNNMNLISHTMFKLLPVQILLTTIVFINELISSFFANNFIGPEAMSLIGLYSPLNILIKGPNTMFLSGVAILIGKYWGKNDERKIQSVFSTSILASFTIGVFFILIFGFLGFFGLTSFITNDENLKPIFNQYLLVQCIGIIPVTLGGLLSTFTSMENQKIRNTIASIIYIISNYIFHYIFVIVLKLESLGLALASALSNWIFFLILFQYFISKKSHLYFSLKNFDKNELKCIMHIGYPKLLREGYQTLRGFILNLLLGIYVGVIGISSFAIARNVTNFFWALIIGMIAVSRTLLSISFGEEDIQTLKNTIKVIFKKFTPIICCFVIILFIFAKPIIHIFFNNTNDPTFMMTVWGFRLFLISMPIGFFGSIFNCYAQISGNQKYVNIHFLLEEFVCIVVFTFILIPFIGIYSVYISYIIKSVVLSITMPIFSILKYKKFPRNIESLLLIPDNFGAKEENRLDITIRELKEVVTIAERIQPFCISKGIDKRRSYIAALVLEEMAGNIIEHGFNKDKKAHYVEIRIVYKDDNVILRLKDNCIAFDPKARQKLTNQNDSAKNIGLRIVFNIAKDIQYQNILGLNCLRILI